MGIMHLLLHSNYKFLDLHDINLKLNIFSCTGFLIRCSLPLLFPLVYQKIFILIILMHMFAFFSLLNFVKNFPIRSPVLNPLFSSLLLSFEMILLTMTFWAYFGVLLEETVFYIIMIGMVLCFKLGWTFSYSKKFNIFLSNFSYKGFVDYALEEMFYLFNNFQGSTSNFFLMLGILKFHTKACSNPLCKLKSKTMKKFHELPLIKKTNIINSFILQRFTKEIEKECKIKGNMNEVLIFKYISYLINSNCNTSKAFYETQKIKLLYQHRTFLGEILIASLLKKVEKKIQEIEKEKSIAQRKTLEKSLEVSSFFRICREKHLMEEKLKKLIQLKISFWETYKEGFESYDHLLKSLSDLFSKIGSFQEHLKELSMLSVDQYEKIVLFRFYSIFHCIIFNQLPEALQFEEQIDNIRKRFIHIDKEKLSPLMFLKDNVVVCEASFLNSNGKILETSKTEKLAKFFGYSMQDLKLVNTIDAFMPKFIADYHSKLIFWSYVKTRKEQIAYEWEVNSHAKDKEGFLFPVKMILGYNFHYMNDYVANAGIMRIQDNGYEEVLINPEGNILGFNREFFEFFQNKYPTITIKQLEAACLYCIIPRVKEIIEKEGVFKERKTLAIRNQLCVITLPHNLVDIIEVLLYYRLEVEKMEGASEKNSGYVSSSNTYRTNRSTYSNNPTKNSTAARTLKQNKDLFIRLNNFILKTQSLKTKKEVIIGLFQDHTLTPESIMDKLIEPHHSDRCKTVVDLSFKYLRYGKAQSNLISIGQVAFTKINQIEKSEAYALKEQNFEESMISGDLGKPMAKEESMISDNVLKPITLPPQNQPEFGLEFERLMISNPTSRSQPDSKINVIKANYSAESFENKEKNLYFVEKKADVKFNLLQTKEEEKEVNFIPVLFSMKTEEIKEKDEKILENFENMKLSLKSSSKSKTSDENKIKKVEGKNQTTEQFVLKEMEMQGSVKSSSTNTGKNSFNVLTILGMMHKKLPKNMLKLNYLLILQIILILCFCVIYYMFAGQYISSSYEPLKIAFTNQMQINAAIAVATTVFVNLENYQLGFKNLSNFELNEMFVILDKRYETATELFYQDRNTVENFDFSNYLQNLYVTYVDYNDFIAKQVLLADETDILLDVTNTVLKIRNVFNMQDIILVLPRNYIDYLIVTKPLRDRMMNEFLNSNDVITQKLIILLIIAISFVGIMKLYEFFILSDFYYKITRLLNIFLRNSAKDAINEVFFLKEILENIKDQGRTFMVINFSGRLLNKRNYAIQSEEDNNLNQNRAQNKEKQMKKSKKKQFSLKKSHNMISSLHPFSKTKILLFLFITGGCCILYFAFDYYYWISCNSNIQSLLVRTDVVVNLFLYSVTAPTINNLLLREIIKRDPEYEASGAEYQIHANRLSELSDLLDSRTASLESYLEELPSDILVVAEELNDPLFDEIIVGNVCQVLQIKGIIDDDEYNFCITCFNGAMNKGILGALNQYLNQMISIRYLSNITNLNTDEENLQSIANIKNFIISASYSDIVMGPVFLNNALLLFYDFFSQFYLNQLYTSIGQLTVFVWIMCTICAVGMTILMWILWAFLKKMYNMAMGSLELIPLEKLSFDEQTIFLIKNFYKEQI